MGDIITSFILSAGPEFAVVFIGLLIILGSGINIPGKISVQNWVRNILRFVGFAILLIGLYFMLLKIGFDFFIEFRKLITWNNAIILIVAGIAYLINEKNKYSIDVKVFPENEQVHVNVVNNGRADTVLVAHLDYIELLEKENKIIPTPSSILAWQGSAANVRLMNMQESNFCILTKYDNNICLDFSTYHKHRLESNKKYKISISIYRWKWKSPKHLMKNISAEFLIKELQSSYVSDEIFEIKWYPKKEN